MDTEAAFLAQKIELNGKVPDNLEEWFLQHTGLGETAWLLAFQDDGVVWGRVDTTGQSPRLVCSPQAFPSSGLPALRGKTLQKAFLFGSGAEVRLWKDDCGMWQARRISDRPEKKDQVITQELILWGSQVVQTSDAGFTLVEDGRQGLRHPVPLPVKESSFGKPRKERPLRIIVTQYINFDQDGQAYIENTRLSGLRAEE